MTRAKITARRRLTRTERDALADIAGTPGVYRPQTKAHEQLLRRALIKVASIDVHHTAVHPGTPEERRTSRRVTLFVLTLRGLQCVAQLRANGDRSARSRHL